LLEGRDRFRLRLRLQVPERRAWGGRLALRAPVVPRAPARAGRLVRLRPGPAVRDERSVPSGHGRRSVPDRYAARAQSGAAPRFARVDRPGRGLRAPREVTDADSASAG